MKKYQPRILQCRMQLYSSICFLIFIHIKAIFFPRNDEVI